VADQRRHELTGHVGVIAPLTDAIMVGGLAWPTVPGLERVVWTWLLLLPDGRSDDLLLVSTHQR
jgi:hypothetical protein